MTIFVSSPAWGSDYLASPLQSLSGEWRQTAGHQVQMPPAYSAESRDISFCYGFTAATLINHMLFATDPSDYQPISMLDLSINGMGMGAIDIELGEQMSPAPRFDDLGNDYRVLIYGLLKKQVATEACMPFDRLQILRSSTPNRSERFQEFVSTLASPASRLPEERRTFAQASSMLISQEPRLGNSAEVLQSIFNKSRIESYADVMTLMGHVLIPKTCESQRIQIPHAQAARFNITSENRAQIFPHFVSVLNRNRPLSWQFCINESCDQQHVLVITGWRKICRANGCVEQFQMRDSGSQVSANPGDYWVDTSTVNRKLDIMFSQMSSLSDRGLAPDLIVNLEF